MILKWNICIFMHIHINHFVGRKTYLCTCLWKFHYCRHQFKEMCKYYFWYSRRGLFCFLKFANCMHTHVNHFKRLNSKLSSNIGLIHPLQGLLFNDYTSLILINWNFVLWFDYQILGTCYLSILGSILFFSLLWLISRAAFSHAVSL